jgi:ComF family protein
VCSRGADWLCIFCRKAACPKYATRSRSEVLLAQDPAQVSAVESLYRLKYNLQRNAGEYLASLMASALSYTLGTSGNYIIVPVPTDEKRRRQRGFDQADLLSLKLANLTNIPIAYLLQRGRKTIQQVGLNKEERMKNLRGAFRVVSSIPRATIILIDDVCTTGATMLSAVKALEEAGAVDILPFVLFGKINNEHPVEKTLFNSDALG